MSLVTVVTHYQNQSSINNNVGYVINNTTTNHRHVQQCASVNTGNQSAQRGSVKYVVTTTSPHHSVVMRLVGSTGARQRHAWPPPLRHRIAE